MLNIFKARHFILISIVVFSCGNFSFAVIPEEVTVSLEEQIDTQLNTTVNELLDRETLCKELYFTWPLTPPGKNEEDLQKEVLKLVKQRAEEQYPMTLKERYKKEAMDQYRLYKIGGDEDQITVKLKDGEVIEGFFASRNKNELMIGRRKVSIFDLEDEELAHFNENTGELKINQYVRGKLAELEENRLNYGEKIKEEITITLYKQYGYIQMDGAWIAKSDFIDKKQIERKRKLKKKLKPLLRAKLYYENGYVLYNDDWISIDELRKIQLLLKEQNQLQTEQTETEQQTIKEGESEDDEGGIWDD